MYQLGGEGPAEVAPGELGQGRLEVYCRGCTISEEQSFFS